MLVMPSDFTALKAYSTQSKASLDIAYLYDNTSPVLMKGDDLLILVYYSRSSMLLVLTDLE